MQDSCKISCILQEYLAQAKFLQEAYHSITRARASPSSYSYWKQVSQICTKHPSYLEARCSVKQLYNMANRSLWGLWESRLQPLDDEHDQDFPGQGRTVLQGQKDKLQDFLLHGRAQKLASSGPDSGPKVGRQLLRVLVLENQLSDWPLTQRSERKIKNSSDVFLKNSHL